MPGCGLREVGTVRGSVRACGVGTADTTHSHRPVLQVARPETRAGGERRLEREKKKNDAPKILRALPRRDLGGGRVRMHEKPRDRTICSGVMLAICFCAKAIISGVSIEGSMAGRRRGRAGGEGGDRVARGGRAGLLTDRRQRLMRVLYPRQSAAPSYEPTTVMRVE